MLWSNSELTWQTLESAAGQMQKSKVIKSFSYNISEMELASSCRNDGTDLLSPLSFSGLENSCSGCEGTVETEEQQFKRFQK